jgi:hypothetical protein
MIERLSTIGYQRTHGFDVNGMTDRYIRNTMCSRPGTARQERNSPLQRQLTASCAGGAEPRTPWCSLARSVVLGRTIGWSSKPQILTSVRADLPATAEPVLDRDERFRIFEAIVIDLDHPRHRTYLAQLVEPVEDWVAGSPLSGSPSYSPRLIRRVGIPGARARQMGKDLHR